MYSLFVFAVLVDSAGNTKSRRPYSHTCIHVIYPDDRCSTLCIRRMHVWLLYAMLQPAVFFPSPSMPTPQVSMSSTVFLPSPTRQVQSVPRGVTPTVILCVAPNDNKTPQSGNKTSVECTHLYFSRITAPANFESLVVS